MTSQDASPPFQFFRTPNRFELHIDNVVAAFADYNVLADGTIVLPHTVTDPAYRGKGLAARLVEHVLDEIADEGGHVRPTCWYVAQFIDQHAQYQSLVI